MENLLPKITFFDKYTNRKSKIGKTRNRNNFDVGMKNKANHKGDIKWV